MSRVLMTFDLSMVSFGECQRGNKARPLYGLISHSKDVDFCE